MGIWTGDTDKQKKEEGSQTLRVEWPASTLAPPTANPVRPTSIRYTCNGLITTVSPSISNSTNVVFGSSGSVSILCGVGDGDEESSACSGDELKGGGEAESKRKRN